MLISFIVNAICARVVVLGHLPTQPLIDYQALIWRDQILDFIREVMQQRASTGLSPSSPDKLQPCVVSGNSLGGFAALAAAAANSKTCDLIRKL